MGKIRLIYYKGVEIDPHDLELLWENNRYSFKRGTLSDYEACVEEEIMESDIMGYNKGYCEGYDEGYDDNN